jgi:hypothetical protein
MTFLDWLFWGPAPRVAPSKPPGDYDGDDVLVTLASMPRHDTSHPASDNGSSSDGAGSR